MLHFTSACWLGGETPCSGLDYWLLLLLIMDFVALCTPIGNMLIKHAMIVIMQVCEPGINFVTPCCQMWPGLRKGSYNLSKLLCLTNHNFTCFQLITLSHQTIVLCQRHKETKFRGDTTFTGLVTGYQIEKVLRPPFADWQGQIQVGFRN